MRGGRSGRTLPAADAGRPALARHHPHRSLRLHVEHEIRSAYLDRHRGGRARPPPRRARSARRAGRTQGQDGGRLLHARRRAERCRPQVNHRARTYRDLTLLAARHDDVDASAALALLSAQAVRERANEMLELGLANALTNFRVDAGRLQPAADFVANVIRENYPGLHVPPHARWRHFVFSGRDLWQEIAQSAIWSNPAARARAQFDLAIVSVLLDAGAGADWRFNDQPTGLTVGRSEGLALASLRMFASGFFSSDPRDPLRADAVRLAALATDDLARGFQVGAENPIAGLEGRAALLARLG